MMTARPARTDPTPGPACRLTQVPDVPWGGLHAVAGGQPLLQQGGELLRELVPVVLAHLVLEAVEDLQGGGGGGQAGN